MKSTSNFHNILSAVAKYIFHSVFTLLFAAALVGAFNTREARAATFTVTNTSDLCLGVPCLDSFRKAIENANENPGMDTIVFNIPGTGVKTIAAAGLSITDPVFIDGWSQGGAGYTGPPLIEITPPAFLTGTGPGLSISTNNTTVRGLILNAFKNIPPITPGGPITFGSGIVIFGDSNVIEGCYIGTTASGQAGSPNEGNGIRIEGNNNVVGGVTAGARNIISSNGSGGFEKGGVSVQGNNNSVIGNYIGVGADGFTDLGNYLFGVFIAGDANRVGGLPFGDITRGNIISGNGSNGIVIGEGSTFAGNPGDNSIVQGNYIGVGANGTTPVPNSTNGIVIDLGSNIQIGGVPFSVFTPGNVIAFNSHRGILVGIGNTRNRISANSIYNNNQIGGLNLPGIDLNGTGLTLNDECDTDEGANKLQNFPVITSALSFGGNTFVEGTLNSIPDLEGPYSIEFFSNTSCNINGHGEGRTYLGSRNVTITRPGCNGSFNTSFSVPVTPGSFITATATDPDGNTSEFSLCRLVAASTLQFSAASFSANENGGSATITVTRTGSTVSAANVNYATSSGTATAGTDYANVSGILNFDIGETSKTFTIPIFDDTVSEGNETVNLALQNLTGAGAALGSPSTAVLTIVDNETQPTISVNDVGLPEGNTGTTNFTFTVSLSAPSSQTVSVTYATADSTATAPIDYQSTGNTLTYMPGETSKTFSVIVNGDITPEPDERFFVNLINPTNATILDNQGLGTIVNDDICSNSINPTSVNSTTGGGTGIVNVTSACSWTAVSNAAWITVTGGANGTGNGTVNYSVAANSGAARMGTITIAGQTFTVNQAAASTDAPFDFDGDGRTDISVYRPTEGNWYIILSQTQSVRAQGWGLSADKLAPADFDGDGKTDLAVFREADSNWYIFNSQTNTATIFGWGLTGDLPVPADYNGDGKADITVYRPSESNWYRKDSDGQINIYAWGILGDKPAPADFNGDGVADMTVFRPSEGKWYTINSGSGAISEGQWGLSGDIPIPADYNGDGKADFCVFRPSDNTWYRIHSNDFTISIITWGLAGDLPVPGDYDGDGRSDLAVFRPSNATWFLNTSTSGIYSQPFGLTGDKPTPNAFVY